MEHRRLQCSGSQLVKAALVAGNTSVCSGQPTGIDSYSESSRACSKNKASLDPCSRIWVMTRPSSRNSLCTSVRFALEGSLTTVTGTRATWSFPW